MVEEGDRSFGEMGYLVLVGHGEGGELNGIGEKVDRAMLVELMRLGNGKREL